MPKRYEAIYLPGRGDESDPSKRGFKSADEAYTYIRSCLCDECQALWDADEPDHCSAEWMVDDYDD